MRTILIAAVLVVGFAGAANAQSIGRTSDVTGMGNTIGGFEPFGPPEPPGPREPPQPPKPPEPPMPPRDPPYNPPCPNGPCVPFRIGINDHRTNPGRPDDDVRNLDVRRMDVTRGGEQIR